MLNRCEFIGNLGADPEIRSFSNGDKVASIRIAVTERWKDKNSGEVREQTEWVSIAIFGPLVNVAERYLKKGSKIYAAGKWKTRKWQSQSGEDRYTTECVLQGFDAKLIMLDGKPDNSDRQGGSSGAAAGGASRTDYDDEVPFSPEWRV